MKRIPLFLLAMVALPSCQQSSTPTDSPHATSPEALADVPPLAATASILGVAARDVLEVDEPVLIVGPPKNRPGQSSLGERQLQQLRGCEMLFRFDFQSTLDEQLASLGDNAPRIVTINAPGGMCQPDSYLGICQQVGNALVERGRLSQEEADQRAARIAVRLEELFSWMRGQVVAADLRYASVLASESQAGFCRQLGLDVMATFSDVKSASETSGEIDHAADIGTEAAIRFIITNRDGEREVAEALADRIGVPIIEFSNVPETPEAGAFDEMVRGNIRALIDASTESLDGK